MSRASAKNSRSRASVQSGFSSGIQWPAPSATPRPVVDTINKHFNALLATQEAKEFLNKFGGDPYISTPDEGQARLIKDIQAWGDYVRIAKIEPQG